MPRAVAALVHELRLFFVAWQFLTRLPVPGWVGHEPAWLNRAVRYFPLVGMLVGAAGAVMAWCAQLVWPPAVAATLAVATTLWLTAAFHEDGLADTFDALLGAAPRDKALEIMKDSRIGSYGAAVLVLGLLVMVQKKMAWGAAAALAGVFAFFHGAAHGYELAQDSALAALGAIAGMAAGSALLHLSGIVLGHAVMQRHQVIAKLAGGLTAALGAFMLTRLA